MNNMSAEGLLQVIGNIKRSLSDLKRGSIQMKFPMAGQEKGDSLIQVTA
jgi:hypothetical protein